MMESTNEREIVDRSDDRAGLDLQRFGPFRAWLRSCVQTIPGFVIPLFVLLYLGLDAGGYDIIVRSQLGILAWWVVLLGLTIGSLPVAKMTRSGWVIGSILMMLLAWTALGALTWTESTERGVIEVGRILTLLGFFALFLLFQGREGLRRSVTALGVAVGVIAAVALLDRLEPTLLPFLESRPIPEGYPRARLRFPLDYWNGLAAMLAIGLPALVWIGTEGRTRLGRVVASGAIPLVGLALYLTFSRGGLVEVLIAIVVLLLLFPRRLQLFAVALFPTVATVFLVSQVNARQELLDFLPSETAAVQAGEMFWITGAAALTTVLVRLLLDLGFESGRLKIPRVTAGLTRLVGAFALGTLVLAVLAGIGTGFFGDRIDEFRQPTEPGGNVSERLGTIGSSERYFLYDAAIAAGRTEPVTGVGPGTFEFWWSREGEGEQFVRDAHSLYLEALAELGVPGLLLVLALVLAPTVTGVRLLLRSGSGETRGLLAVAVASMAAFTVAAGIDWAWELTVLPTAFLLLAAAVVGSGASVLRSRTRASDGGFGWAWRSRVIGAAFALLAIAMLAIPMRGTELVRDSQAQVRAGNTSAALDLAGQAISLQPWSASALVQRAQVLELLGRNREAAVSARAATRREPVNWRNWYVLASVLGDSDPTEAAEALRRAGDLRGRVGGAVP